MAAPLGAIPIELARRIFFYRPGDKSDVCGIDAAFESPNGRFLSLLCGEYLSYCTRSDVKSQK
jgi:hypothetical protein